MAIKIQSGTHNPVLQERSKGGQTQLPGGAGSAEPTLSVCHVITGQIWAGAQVQVATLLDALARMPGINLHCIVFEEDRLAQELRNSGVRVKVIAREHAGSLVRIVSQSADFLSGQNVQIIHGHGYKESIVASVLSKWCHIPVQVRTFHGSRTPFTGFKPKHRVALFLDRLTTRHCVDHSITVSSHLANELKPEVGDKISIIKNGVDVNHIVSGLSVEEAKRRLQIPEDALVVGAVARLEEVKRLDLFEAAAAIIASELPHAHFVIAGVGSQESLLKDLFRKSGLQDRVHFLGHRDDAWDVLRAFDLLLITSDQEGLPMVLLEAMALRVPVISRAVGGIPEAIQDGHSGILVPTGDPRALAQDCLLALRNPELRRRMALAAEKIVASQFSAQSNANQVLEIYQSLIRAVAVGS